MLSNLSGEGACVYRDGDRPAHGARPRKRRPTGGTAAGGTKRFPPQGRRTGGAHATDRTAFGEDGLVAGFIGYSFPRARFPCVDGFAQAIRRRIADPRRPNLLQLTKTPLLIRGRSGRGTPSDGNSHLAGLRRCTEGVAAEYRPFLTANERGLPSVCSVFSVAKKQLRNSPHHGLPPPSSTSSAKNSPPST